MEPKGFVIIKNKMEFTTFPEDKEKEYRSKLEGHLCKVMDIAVDKSGYLVFGIDSSFIWHVDVREVEEFIESKSSGDFLQDLLKNIEELKGDIK